MRRHPVAPSLVVEVGKASGSADGVARGHESVQFSSPVGACLLKHWKVWRELGADPRVVKVLRKGFTIKYLQPCSLSSKSGYARLPLDPAKMAALDEEVHQMTLKVAIEPVPVGQACFHSHLAWYPRKEGNGDRS